LTLIITPALALMFSVVTTTTPASPSARASVPELSWCVSDAGLAIGSSGSSVACLQFTLAAMGLYHKTLTQEYDRPTAEAMAIFQANHPPLRVDGIASPLALTEMGIYSGTDSAPPPLCLADARLAVGAKGDSVKCLQDKLIEDGYLLEKATGTFDKLTADAVRGFQFATPPLNTDGVAGPSTLAAMGIWSGKSINQGGGTASSSATPRRTSYRRRRARASTSASTTASTAPISRRGCAPPLPRTLRRPRSWYASQAKRS